MPIINWSGYKGSLVHPCENKLMNNIYLVKYLKNNCRTVSEGTMKNWSHNQRARIRETISSTGAEKRSATQSALKIQLKGLGAPRLTADGPPTTGYRALAAWQPPATRQQPVEFNNSAFRQQLAGLDFKKSPSGSVSDAGADIHGRPEQTPWRCFSLLAPR